MSAGLFWLLAAVVFGAAVLVAHVALLLRVMRSELEPKWKWLSLVPVLTPVAAWRADHRKAVMVWVGLVGTYLLVRLVW